MAPARTVWRTESRRGQQTGRFGSRRQALRFDDIAALGVQGLGDREGGSERFHVCATLRSGREVALFLGFFDGAHSRQAVEARCQRLQAMVRAAG